MSNVIKPTGQAGSRVDRRSALKTMGIGTLGTMLGAGGALTHPWASPASAAQAGNCGTVIGAVLNSGGKQGFDKATFNIVTPPSPQVITWGQLLRARGSVPLLVRLDDESMTSLIEEGVPDVREQLLQGGGFKLEMGDGKRISAEQLQLTEEDAEFGSFIQLLSVSTNFTKDLRFNVSGFLPEDALQAANRSGLVTSRLQGGGVIIVVIFGVLIIITALICAWLQWQAARTCDRRAVIRTEWSWFRGLKCTFECR